MWLEVWEIVHFQTVSDNLVIFNVENKILAGNFCLLKKCIHFSDSAYWVIYNYTSAIDLCIVYSN